MDIFEICIKMLALAMFYFEGLAQGSDQQEYIKWSDDLVVVDEGDNIQLSCTSSGMTMFDVLRLARNFDIDESGQQVTEDAEFKVRESYYGDETMYDDFEESFTLVDNTDVKSPRISRYSFQFEKNSTFGTIHFNIRGALPKDSGVVSCFKLNKNRVVVRTRIIVRERSKEGRFVVVLKKSGDVIVLPKNSTELSLNTDIHDGFGCLISGFNGFSDLSTLTLTLDDRRVKDVIYKKYLKRTPVSDRDMPQVQYWSIAMLRDIDLLSQDGKKLECSLKEQSREVQVFKNYLRIHYPPIIKSCSRNRHHDRHHHQHPDHHHQQQQPNESLACHVMSQTAFTVKVTSGDGRLEVKHSLTEQALSKQEVKINVTLHDSLEQHSLMLHLANSYGLRTKIFNMSQDNYEFDDEPVMQKDVKTDFMNVGDVDYQLTVKTVQALGSRSNAQRSAHRESITSALVIIVIIIAACL